jgi:hypothetical protein
MSRLMSITLFTLEFTVEVYSTARMSSFCMLSSMLPADGRGSSCKKAVWYAYITQMPEKGTDGKPDLGAPGRRRRGRAHQQRVFPSVQLGAGQGPALGANSARLVKAVDVSRASCRRGHYDLVVSIAVQVS